MEARCLTITNSGARAIEGGAQQSVAESERAFSEHYLTTVWPRPAFRARSGRQSGPRLAAAHASLGTVAELFALYILMAAGTNILPQRLRFTRYRPWMRAALFLWWLALLFGLATYVRWYVMPLFS